MEVSIIITAYKSSSFIERCLNSVYVQSGAKCEVLVGVDGCAKTLLKLKSIQEKYPGLKVYLSEENNGTYPMRNALAAVANGKHLLFFDSDDEMYPNMLSETIHLEKDFITYVFKHHGTPNNFVSPHPAGAFWISKDLFNLSGGFRNWKCAADTEFYKRMRENNINDLMHKKPLFTKYVHKGNLTVTAETGMNSDIRKQYKDWMYTNKDWTLPIQTEKTRIKYIFSHQNTYFYNQNDSIMGIYKFKNEFKDVTVTMTIGGTPVNVTADNLTDSVAKHILESRYAHVIEQTATQKKTNWEVKEVKKPAGKEATSQEATSSTSTEAPKEDPKPKPNSKKPASKQKGSKPSKPKTKKAN